MKYSFSDIAIIFTSGFVVTLPYLIGLTVIAITLIHLLVKFWKDFLFGGMDSKKRYEYTTITFRTKKW